MDLEKAIDQVDDPVVLDPGSGVGTGLPPTGHGRAPLSRLPDQQEAIEELDGVVFVETAVVDQLLVLVPGPAALAGQSQRVLAKPPSGMSRGLRSPPTMAFTRA
jgi:hypothetical protein